MNRLTRARQGVQATMNKAKARIEGFTRPRNDGKALEEDVGNILRKEGFRKVELNNRVKDVHGNWSEIDVIGTQRDFFHRFFSYSKHIPWGSKRILVECKQYSADNRVSLGDVSKFKEVLQLNGESLKDGLFVTTSTYVPRATTIGVRTVDGTALRHWKNKHREPNPIYLKFKYATRVGVVAICLFVYAQMMFDLREARTKTMNYIDDVQNLDSYKAEAQKYGLDGFVVTAGQSPEDRFSTFVNTFDFLMYWSKYLYYKATSQDPSKIPQPTNRASNTVQYEQGYKPFVAPKINTTYMAYELHRPMPTEDTPRDQAITFVEQQGQKVAENHHILSKLPLPFVNYYSRYSMSHDYVLFNVNTKEFPAKFLPTPLSTEFFQVVETNGQTLFKIPIHHAMSVPNYFTSYLTYRIVQFQQFMKKFDTPVINDPADNSIGSRLSSNGSLFTRDYDTPGSQEQVTMTQRTSQKSFGDSFFDQQFNDPRATKVKVDSDFTRAMPSTQLLRTSDTFDRTTTHQLGRDESNFDADTTGVDSFSESEQFYTRGYSIVHAHDDDDAQNYKTVTAGWTMM